MEPEPKKYYSPEEYLAIEREAEFKSEYIHGEIVAMAGASRNHNRITLNAAVSLHSQFRKRECEVYANDMRVCVAATGLYTYPDVVAVCDAPQFEDEQTDTLVNPAVIIEVLSESTESYDRGAKFAHYRRIASLKEYILISQQRHMIEHFICQSRDKWLLYIAEGPEAEIELPSIDCILKLADVYEKVEFS